MKKCGFIIALAFLAASCSNSPNQKMDMKGEHQKVTANPNAKVDPVCGMAEGKEHYTEFTVNQNDTVWFCSPHCKGKFDEHPHKYVKN